MAEQKKPMTKAQIVAHFATKFGMTRKQAADVLEELTALAIDQTKKVGTFILPGIAKISKVKRKGPQRPKSCNRRNHQDPAQDRGQDSPFQGLRRGDRALEKS